MTDKEILQQVIERAEAKGFTKHLEYLPLIKTKDPERLMQTVLYGVKEKIIFSHEFAKAFWGEGESFDHENHFDYVSYCWKCNLQKMVLEEEPLKYLERFLDDSL